LCTFIYLYIVNSWSEENENKNWAFIGDKYEITDWSSAVIYFGSIYDILSVLLKWDCQNEIGHSLPWQKVTGLQSTLKHYSEVQGTLAKKELFFVRELCPISSASTVSKKIVFYNA